MTDNSRELDERRPLLRAADETQPNETDGATVERYFEMGPLCAEAQRLSMESAN